MNDQELMSFAIARSNDPSNQEQSAKRCTRQGPWTTNQL